MLISAKRTILVGVSVLTLGGTMAAAGCSDRFATCKDNRTCAPSEAAGGAAGGNAEDAGGRASPDGGSGANEVEGGRDSSGAAGNGDEPPAEGGSGAVGGAPSEEPQPPAGAFAWYKATEEDVTLVHASIADANDFIKSPWIKSLVTVTALQPDVDGGTTATAVYGTGPVSGEHSLRHVVSGAVQALKTYRIRARMGEARYLWIGAPSATAQPANAPLVFFDLLDGAVALVGPSIRDLKITPLKNLWYECEVKLVGGNELSVGFSRAVGSKTDSWATATKPLALLQSAEVEQDVVSTWRDRVGGRNFVAPVPGWAWRRAASELNGAPALEGNGLILYPPKMRAGEAADWSFLHDGSGGTLVVAMRNLTTYDSFHVARTEEDQVTPGARLGGSADGSTWEYAATNGKAALFSINGGSSSGTKWLAAGYGTDRNPQAQLFENGILVASANPTSAPVEVASDDTLTLGGTDASQQLVSEVLVYNRALGSEDIEELKRYFAALVQE